MEERKLRIVLEALADQIERLTAELSYTRYRNEELKKENESLKTEVARLLGLPDSILKKENGHV